MRQNRPQLMGKRQAWGRCGFATGHPTRAAFGFIAAAVLATSAAGAPSAPAAVARGESTVDGTSFNQVLSYRSKVAKYRLSVTTSDDPIEAYRVALCYERWRG